MRILWLSHLIPYPPKGGVLQRSYHLIKELSRYHQIDLLAFNQHALLKPSFNSMQEGITQARKVLSKFCNYLEFVEIPSQQFIWSSYAVAIKSLFYEPYNINWLKSANFARVLKKRLHDYKYDLVHFDTISLVPYFSMLPSGVATCLDHHNIESHMLLRRANRERNPLKKLYFWQEGMRLTRYERNFCPKFSLNITCSDIDKERLLNIAPESTVKTIPNGVDLEYFKPKARETTSKRIIFVGRMSWYPNIEAVLYIGNKIWPTLKEKYPDLHCDIIGANPPNVILDMGKRLPDFHVHGFVDNVKPYMESAPVYVCPIQDGGGTKLKILDAMAMSKAIVAHPVSCEGIDVTDNHNVLLAGDKKAFFEKISLLLDSSDKRIALGKEARKLVQKHYNYNVIGKQLATDFERSLK